MSWDPRGCEQVDAYTPMDRRESVAERKAAHIRKINGVFRNGTRVQLNVVTNGVIAEIAGETYVLKSMQEVVDFLEKHTTYAEEIREEQYKISVKDELTKLRDEVAKARATPIKQQEFESV